MLLAGKVCATFFLDVGASRSGGLSWGRGRGRGKRRTFAVRRPRGAAACPSPRSRDLAHDAGSSEPPFPHLSSRGDAHEPPGSLWKETRHPEGRRRGQPGRAVNTWASCRPSRPPGLGRPGCHGSRTVAALGSCGPHAVSQNGRFGAES